MKDFDLRDLDAFVAVARTRNFRRAAVEQGVSVSSLSQRLRDMEERLGVRLLTRTTRSVAPTEAGERLLRSIGPHLDEIEAELAALGELRDKPAGTIRITASEHAAATILWPALARLLPDYPDIKVEISIESALTVYASSTATGGSFTGTTVTLTVAVSVRPCPSSTVYIKVSGP